MTKQNFKIGIVSFENPWDDESFRPNRLSSLQKIAKEVKKKALTHLFFPGSTIDYSYSANIGREIKRDLAFMTAEFRFLSIIFELTDFYPSEYENKNYKKLGLYCFEKGKNLTTSPIKQLFVTSKSDKEKYEQLWEATATGNRTFFISGLKVLIWICGEINYLRNAQSDNNKVKGVRYNFRPNIAPNNLNYDIFFNPTHEPLKALMGKYKERLLYMSKKKRISILNLNVDDSQVQRKGTIFCFKDGKELLTKDMKTEWEDSRYKIEIIQF